MTDAVRGEWESSPDGWAISRVGEPGDGSLCPTVWTRESAPEIRCESKARFGRRAS